MDQFDVSVGVCQLPVVVLTQEIAERGISRAFGADDQSGSKIDSIRIVGPDFDITVPRIR